MIGKLAIVVGAVFGIVMCVMEWGRRSDRSQIIESDKAFARERSGKSWTVLLTRCGSGVRRAVSRWAHGKSKRKGLSKAQLELKKLTWEARR